MLGADINKAEGEYATYVNIGGNETGGPVGLEDRKVIFELAEVRIC